MNEMNSTPPTPAQKPSAWFVTGTDTEIGKTFVTCALLHAFRAAGFSAAGMKPVAAGCDETGENEDVAALRAASSPLQALPREWVNPWCFAQPVAPHIAAREEGRIITMEPVLSAFAHLSSSCDVVLVEGVGGFRVPLGRDFDSADLACAFGLPLLLVVGLRLGCINHALLTAEAIRARGLTLAGWVANTVDPHMLRRDENLEALRERLDAPLLGLIPHLDSADPSAAAAFLRLP
ncbi:MAG: dethiobiotin synthase [Betaproteobacteria bacterium]|nr:dethiobiotin synthase [Betaproteobacteria bacterium]